MQLGVVGPALAHLDGLLPAGEALAGVLGGDLGLKGGAAFGVDVCQVVEAVPDTNGQTSGNGSAKSSGLAHGGTDDGDANEVGLCLFKVLVSGCCRNAIVERDLVLTCMMRSELHMPPSTASSVRA